MLHFNFQSSLELNSKPNNAMQSQPPMTTHSVPPIKITSCLKEKNAGDNMRGRLRVHFKSDRVRRLKRLRKRQRETNDTHELLQTARYQKLRRNEFDWYQIVVPNGQRYTQEEVLSTLHILTLPRSFQAQYWHVCTNSVFFMVQDYTIAEQLHNASGAKLRMSDGHFLSGWIVRGRNPIIKMIDLNLMELILQVLHGRYCESTKSLNLKKFHTDLLFGAKFCPLAQQSVLNAVLDVIVGILPELSSMNLCDNSLRSLAPFTRIKTKLSKLSKLDLSCNHLQCYQLSYIAGLPLTELWLSDNPMEQSLTIKRVKEIFNLFPKLYNLNDKWHRNQGELEPHEVMQAVVFKPENETQALCQHDQQWELMQQPLVAAPAIANCAIISVVRQFLIQYFGIFDEPAYRHEVGAYYDSQAILTLNIGEPTDVGQVIFGIDDIVATHAKWPRSIHNPAEFKIAVTACTLEMLCCTITGHFKWLRPDLGTEVYQDRYFLRNYMILPRGSSLCIRSEFVSIKCYDCESNFLNGDTVIGSLSNAMENILKLA